MMKRWILGLAVVLVGCGSDSGSKRKGYKPPGDCVFVQTVKDPFEGNVQQVVRDLGGRSALSIINKKSAPYLQVLLTVNGQVPTVAKAGELADLMVGGDAITLPLRADAVPVTNATRYEIYTQWKLEYDLTPAAQERLASARVSAVRVRVAGTESTATLEKLDGTVVKRASRCMFRPRPPDEETTEE
jgi:hypothetical protein